MSHAPDHVAAQGDQAGLASRATPTVLAVRDVFRFQANADRQIPILQGVSFELKRGSFTTIMGPSGSGKSTLLNILSGLDEPSAGEVLLLGAPFSGANERTRTAMRRQHIGYIFQFFHLSPDMTVRENIELPLLIAGERRANHAERVRGLMEALRIDHLADREPQTLSGGEMQRVSIARALVRRPPLLLCDEPTGNLSSKAGEEIVQLLRQVASKQDATVLLVTHNPRDAAVGDRVLFLHDGKMDQSQALIRPSTGAPGQGEPNSGEPYSGAPNGESLHAADVFRRLEELGI